MPSFAGLAAVGQLTYLPLENGCWSSLSPVRTKRCLRYSELGQEHLVRRSLGLIWMTVMVSHPDDVMRNNVRGVMIEPGADGDSDLSCLNVASSPWGEVWNSSIQLPPGSSIFPAALDAWLSMQECIEDDAVVQLNDTLSYGRVIGQ